MREKRGRETQLEYEWIEERSKGRDEMGSKRIDEGRD